MKKLIVCAAIFLVILLPVSGKEQTKFRFPVELAVAGNVIWPGFGLGSLLQGDFAGALIQFLGEGFPAVITLFSFIRYSSLPDAEESLIAGYCSGAVWLGVRLGWGMARPIWYNKNRVAKPHESGATVGITPSITPSAYRRGFDAEVELSLRYALE